MSADLRLQRLHVFNALLLDRATAPGIAHAIVEEGRLAAGACAAAVAAAGDEGAPRILATYGYPDALLGAAFETGEGASPLVDVLNGGDAIWISDRLELQHFYPELATQADDAHVACAALPLDANGRRVGALTLSFERSGPFNAATRSFIMMIAQQCAQALERARLSELAIKARVNAEFAERRLSFLADVSARLAESLDSRVTLGNVASIAVPEVADWCMVHLVDDDRRLRLVAAKHTDPTQAERAQALDARFPLSEHAAAGAGRVIATGEAQFMPELTAADLRAIATDDEHLAGLRTFGLRSQLSVPIPADHGVCGVLTFANAESGRVFGPADLLFATELGLRAGQAVQNARLYQTAYRASEAKSDFLAVMSHELRTPLNAIIGYSDLLLLGVPESVPAQAQRQVERIRSASSSLLHLVEEVLSFSRIEAGKEDIRISPVDVVACARECISMIEPLAEEKGLAVELDVAESPLRVVSDERKVKQILTNLLSNAVKFTEVGGITVRTRRTAEDVCVDVIDTGIGIPAEHVEHIFSPFWQVEQSATRRFGGTGLGLGVARKLARLLEGRLEVNGTTDQGSTFTLSLPLRTPGMPKLK